jgi:hypothetical protein
MKTRCQVNDILAEIRIDYVSKTIEDRYRYTILSSRRLQRRKIRARL